MAGVRVRQREWPGTPVTTTRAASNHSGGARVGRPTCPAVEGGSAGGARWLHFPWPPIRKPPSGASESAQAAPMTFSQSIGVGPVPWPDCGTPQARPRFQRAAGTTVLCGPIMATRAGRAGLSSGAWYGARKNFHGPPSVLSTFDRPGHVANFSSMCPGLCEPNGCRRGPSPNSRFGNAAPRETQRAAVDVGPIQESKQGFDSAAQP